jgi:DNA-binding transcriptional ArsR family regulator
MNDAVAVAANLIAEPARAAMLLELMSGRALPAGELAEAANVTPQTASGHLAKLVEGRFLRVEQQGRHRYYSLASTEVAGAVEALLVLTNGVHRMETRVPALGSLEHARTCYSHLA